MRKAGTNETVIRLHEIVGPHCISTEDGLRVYHHIVPLLREEQAVIVSFAGVDILIPAFLSSAFGRLFGEFPESQIRFGLILTDISSNYQTSFQSVMEWARFYHEQPETHNRIIREVLEEEVVP